MFALVFTLHFAYHMNQFWDDCATVTSFLTSGESVLFVFFLVFRPYTPVVTSLVQFISDFSFDVTLSDHVQF
jgi:hypothetical protein